MMIMNDEDEDEDNEDVDDEDEDDGGCFNWVAMIAMIRSCSDWQRSIVCAIPGLSNFTPRFLAI